LTAEQLRKSRELMRPYIQSSLVQAKQRDMLALDQANLLQEMDLVHGCHVMNLNEPALIANQKQINLLNSSLANERLQVKIEIHKMLSERQKKMIPAPVETSEKDKAAAVVAPPETVYKGVTLSKEQEAKYNSLMSEQVTYMERTKKLR